MTLGNITAQKKTSYGHVEYSIVAVTGAVNYVEEAGSTGKKKHVARCSYTSTKVKFSSSTRITTADMKFGSDVKGRHASSCVVASGIYTISLT